MPDSAAASGTPRASPIAPARSARLLERIFAAGTGVAALVIGGLFVGVAVLLLKGAYPTLEQFGPSLFTRSAWDVNNNIYGLWPEIFGTLVTSSIALVLGVPISLGIATFLSEDAPAFLRTSFAALVELLAAVPSVVYGFWGLVVLAPYMRSSIEPGLKSMLGPVPGIGVIFGGTPVGTDILTAGVILGIMIIPTISAVTREAMQAVPRTQREAALALGATRWESTRHAVLPYAATGIFGAIILGLGRALGETMAVTMTIGNNPFAAPSSLFGQGQTLASGIASQFGESAGPQAVGALLAVGLVLLVITVLVNVVARLLVRGVFRGGSATP